MHMWQVPLREPGLRKTTYSKSYEASGSLIRESLSRVRILYRAQGLPFRPYPTCRDKFQNICREVQGDSKQGRPLLCQVQQVACKRNRENSSRCLQFHRIMRFQ